MGIYRHLTAEELQATRTRLLSSLHERPTLPTSASSNTLSVQLQQRIEDLRRELVEVDREICHVS
jgi:hypothetical protein